MSFLVVEFELHTHLPACDLPLADWRYSMPTSFLLSAEARCLRPIGEGQRTRGNAREGIGGTLSAAGAVEGCYLSRQNEAEFADLSRGCCVCCAIMGAFSCSK